jgi:hypothetical protein
VVPLLLSEYELTIIVEEPHTLATPCINLITNMTPVCLLSVRGRVVKYVYALNALNEL